MRMTGDQPATVWQDSQLLVVWKCVACLPVALTPSWQETHMPPLVAALVTLSTLLGVLSLPFALGVLLPLLPASP